MLVLKWFVESAKFILSGSEIRRVLTSTNNLIHVPAWVTGFFFWVAGFSFAIFCPISGS